MNLKDNGHNTDPLESLQSANARLDHRLLTVLSLNVQMLWQLLSDERLAPHSLQVALNVTHREQRQKHERHQIKQSWLGRLEEFRRYCGS